MATVIFEAALVQLSVETIWPIMKTLRKLFRKLRKAGPQAIELWQDFERQYDTLKRIGRGLKTRYNFRKTSPVWLQNIDGILSRAKRIFEDIVEQMQFVLARKHTWRIKWAIIHKHCNKSFNEIQQLNVELSNIETSIRLEHEISQKETMKKGAIGGGLVGVVAGACIADSALRGAIAGGLVGVLAGAVIGFGIAWYWG